MLISLSLLFQQFKSKLAKAMINHVLDQMDPKEIVVVECTARKMIHLGGKGVAITMQENRRNIHHSRKGFNTKRK